MFSFQGASRQRKLHILRCRANSPAQSFRCASFRSMTGRFAPRVMSRFGNDFFKSFHELSLNEVLNPLRTSFNESSSFFRPPWSKSKPSTAGSIWRRRKESTKCRFCALALRETGMQLTSLDVVGQSGLEPPTSRLSVVCSSQLSYWPIFIAGFRRALYKKRTYPLN